ncbi:hypothetical protein MAR_023254 [Mya arenaria]|uniref:Uncharacterized protein n=1 Tax=Mya arenaria TaxID=6604 RepID=A0ABY7DMF8_MYAAR|nr:hypothetical protein MAR_023254 [Mya arenaria]
MCNIRVMILYLKAKTKGIILHSYVNELIARNKFTIIIFIIKIDNHQVDNISTNEVFVVAGRRAASRVDGSSAPPSSPIHNTLSLFTQTVRQQFENYFP